MITRILRFFSHFIRKETNFSSFHVFRDRKGEWRFSLKAPNHEIIAQSEGYSSKQACLKGLDAVRRYAPKAETIIVTEKR